MNGLDAVIFTGGIGENALVRAVLARYGIFGIKLDEKLIAKQGKLKRFQPKTQKHKSGLFPQTKITYC